MPSGKTWKLNFYIFLIINIMDRLEFKTAVANNGGAMEADTISKNGQNPESQMNKGKISAKSITS